MNLKHHRLKPGGVPISFVTFGSCEFEAPPAKAWWCPEMFLGRSVAVNLKHHRLKPGGVPKCFWSVR